MKSYLLIALALALMAAAPLAYPGPLQTHSGFTELYAFYDGPSTGSGRGAETVGALPWGIAGVLRVTGLSPLDALKSITAVSFLLGALGMFLLARRWYGEAGALAAAALYTMLPYRLMTAYARGATGESLFLGLLPALCYALVGAGGWARARQRRLAGPGGNVLLAALSVAAIALLWTLCVPPAPDLRTTASAARIDLLALFAVPWNTGGSNGLDMAPIQLGIVPVGLSLVALVRQRNRRVVRLAAVAAALCLLSVVLFPAWWPWEAVLGMAGLLLSWLGGGAVSAAPPDGRLTSPPEVNRACVAVVLLAALSGYGYLAPRGLDYTPSHAPVARFGDAAYLVEAATVVAPSAQAGTPLTVTLIWQGLQPFDDDYTVFVHVLDEQDKIWAQGDAVPLNGARPTSGWRSGELLRDTHHLGVPAAAPRPLHLAIGLYRPGDGARLKTTRGEDRVILAPF
ncbi:MAG: hypothetical protein HYR71_11035 [Chloroflexi bacterium]|nr:hypothetical protein [Chloroflexota bacterium]